MANKKKSASAENDVVAQQLGVDAERVEKVEWRDEDVEGERNMLSFLVWLKDDTSGPYQGRVDRATYEGLK